MVFNARLTGEDKTYRTTFDFPDVDTENPEIERLWALDQIEQIDRRKMLGKERESDDVAEQNRDPFSPRTN